jgi:hypothetical protein
LHHGVVGVELFVDVVPHGATLPILIKYFSLIKSYNSTNNSTPTTKPSVNNKKLTVTSNNGLAQIKSDNSGLYT